MGSSRWPAKYEKLKVLGEGNFGTAYLVKDRATGAIYCLKRTLLGSDPDKVRQEAALLSRLDHPNIIRHIENFEHSDFLYIAMEYADGGDLHSMIEEHRPPSYIDENTVLTIFCQVCLGLDYLHAQQILHRDIKPMNVFLMKDGTVKLGDFGIARLLPPQSLARTQVGTPAYLAPELWNGKRYDSKADVWSLACLLYEMCTGRTPFDASNVAAICSKVLNGHFRPITGPYNSDIGRLIGRMLAQAPGDRPSAKQILRMSLLKQHFLALSKTPEPVATPQRRATPPKRPLPDELPNLARPAIRPKLRRRSPGLAGVRPDQQRTPRPVRSPTPPVVRTRKPAAPPEAEAQVLDEPKPQEFRMRLPPALRQSVLDVLGLPAFDESGSAEEGFHEDE
jgi:NIMA (never in mitosis gene a)-related kinase